MKTRLFVAVVLAAAMQGCTGGQLTDGNDNVIRNTSGAYTVSFFNQSTGATYNTVVDSNGYFSFDPYVSGSASNNAVIVPGGTYTVAILNSRSQAIEYLSPFPFQHQFTNSSCPDHWSSTSTEPCALYQIKIMSGTGTATPPYPSTYGGYATTVIPVSTFALHHP
jgi:hypothetical protein